MHKTDKDALRSSLGMLQAIIDGLPSEEDYATVAELIDRMPDTLEEHFEGCEAPEGGVDGTGATLFGLSLVIANSLGSSATRTTIEGDLELTSKQRYTVYFGDLHVRGNLEFNDVLVVLGDLIVDGAISDWEEHSHLWVSGGIRARALKLGCYAWAGKSIAAHLVLLERWGAAYAAGGIEAEVALRDDFDGEGFLGEVRATHVLDLEEDEAAIRAVLRPEFLNDSVDDIPIDDPDLLVAAVLAGQTLTVS